MQNAGYRIGDTIAAIVYDGYVWTTPDFEVTLTPNAGNGITSGYPMDAGSAVAYTLAVAKAGPQPWFGAVDFSLTLNFANTPVPPGTQVTLDGNPLTPGVPYAVTGVIQTGWNGTLRIWSTEAVTQVRYLSGLNLIADSSLGSTRGTSSNFGFGALLGNDYSARTNSGRLVVRQGDSASANLITYGAGASFPNSGQGCSANVQADILLGGAPLPWSTYFSSGQTASVRIRQAADRSLNFALSANAGAPVGSGYTLRLTVPSQICSGGGGVSIVARSVDIPLTILPPAPNATPDRFVFIQGYAVFRISRVDANDVWGYAISPLYPDYNDITVGLQPRLVPWN